MWSCDPLVALIRKETFAPFSCPWTRHCLRNFVSQSASRLHEWNHGAWWQVSSWFPAQKLWQLHCHCDHAAVRSMSALRINPQLGTTLGPLKFCSTWTCSERRPPSASYGQLFLPSSWVFSSTAPRYGWPLRVSRTYESPPVASSQISPHRLLRSPPPGRHLAATVVYKSIRRGSLRPYTIYPTLRTSSPRIVTSHHPAPARLHRYR